MGCTIAVVSAKRPVEHVKNVLQNITTVWMHLSVKLSFGLGLSLRSAIAIAHISLFLWLAN